MLRQANPFRWIKQMQRVEAIGLKKTPLEPIWSKWNKDHMQENKQLSNTWKPDSY